VLPPSPPVLALPETTSEETPAPAQVRSKPPEVTYEDGQLTIIAENSLLSDIMALLRARTGADIEVPASASGEHIWVSLGPGPARKVLASLLSETKLDYVILASDSDPDGIRSVSLTPRTSASAGGANAGSSVGQSIRDSNRRLRQFSSAPPEARVEDQPAPEPAASTEAAPPPEATQPTPAETAVVKDAQAPTDANRPAGNTSDQMMHMLQNMYEERKQQMQQLQKPAATN